MVTRGYRKLQGVTRGLQEGVTRGCRGLQKVKGDNKRLQGVTRGYKGFKGVTVGTWGYKRIERVTGD